MKKVLIGAAAAVALGAAGGAAAWHVAANRVAAAAAAGVAGPGIRATLAEPRVSGFPFAFVLESGEATIAAASGAWSYTAPSSRSAVSLFDWRAIRTELPAQGRLRLAPPDAPALEVDAASEGLVVETGADGRARATASRLALTHAGQGPLRRAELSLAEPVVAVASAAGGALDASLDAPTATLATEAEGADGLSAQRSTYDGLAVRLVGSGFGAADLGAFVDAGGAADLSVAAAATTVETTLAPPEGPSARVEARTGPTEASFVIEDGRVRYAAAVRETLADVDWAPLGLRGAVSAGSGAVAFEMPVRPSAEPQPYALRVSLDGLTADEPLWAAFDPGGALPREPLAINAEIGGQARMVVALSDAAESPVPPVDVRTVEIADLSARGLGAAAAVTGALQLTPGAPAPDGALAVRVEGWRALVDRLEGIGLIDAEQSAFVALLAETYGRPGEAEGALAADIELRDGAVYANGRRVR